MGKSEGKFNYTSDFGGELEQKVGRENLLQLMDEVDEILCHFGGDSVRKYSTANTELSKRAQLCNLQMLTTEVRHLGSSLSTKIFQQIYKVLSSKIDIQFEVDVQDIKKDNNSFTLITSKGDIQSQQVVFATGRSGTDWLKKTMF